MKLQRCPLVLRSKLNACLCVTVSGPAFGSYVVGVSQCHSLGTMAPQLCPAELGRLRVLSGTQHAPAEILEIINRERGKRGIQPTGIDAIRRALRGTTHAPGKPERRGRKPLLGKRAVRSLNAARKKLIKDAKGESEVHWKQVIKAARIKKVHRSTVKRAFQREGIPVAWHRPREKPMRAGPEERERETRCGEWKDLPAKYFTDRIDMIIDNKKFDVPATDRGAAYLKQLRVRGHLRTPQEGLQEGFTRVNPRRNRVNTGGSLNVCAGISGGRVVLWHYLPHRWSGQEAAKLFKGPLLRTLQRCRGQKREYLVIHDNDPTGYMSRVAVEAKAECHIKQVPLPRYSPDVNPCDYWLWNAVQDRMAKHKVQGRESVAKFKARLRRTALNLPEAEVLRAVSAMKSRSASIWEAKGKHIARD